MPGCPVLMISPCHSTEGVSQKSVPLNPGENPVDVRDTMPRSKVSSQDVYLARKRIASISKRTPLLSSPEMEPGLGARVYLKLETVQETGSFKIRGAANKLLSLDAESKSRGVVTASTGNHGRAVSYVAGRLGIPAKVCLSGAVPENKVDAIRKLGAEVIMAGEEQDDALAKALELEAEQGLTMIQPFDDPEVIAGQGTIGLELLEQLPAVTAALVPLSGGGLISGVGLALKSANPGVRLIGVSMENAPVMYQSLRAGRPVRIAEQETLADSLRGGIGLENEFTFNMVQELVDEVILVSEQEIAAAMKFAFREHRLVLEGAGAVGIAAISTGKADHLDGEVAVILSGGNVEADTFIEIVRR